MVALEPGLPGAVVPRLVDLEQLRGAETATDLALNMVAMNVIATGSATQKVAKLWIVQASTNHEKRKHLISL